jgi:GTP pyrophosphokinase
MEQRVPLQNTQRQPARGLSKAQGDRTERMQVKGSDKKYPHTQGLEELISIVSRWNPKADTSAIKKAYEFSLASHKDQKRKSGEPYIQHPLEVARILADLRLDVSSIVTGLLHDTVEDTLATLEVVEKEFGKEVAALVDGVTKISKINFQTTEEKQAENFRKMILAMAKDLRVIVVKLADRLHNMRTLEHLQKEKQVRIAQETLDIYSPLANRLGLNSLKHELEDLSLRYTKPEIYYKLVTQVAKKMKAREEYTLKIKKMVEDSLLEHGYKNTEVTGRQKHFYSIHKKMEKKNLSYDQIHDITGFRITVSTIEQCYGILGTIHSLWTPVPGRFKDYIAIPKANFYQSLHTTVVGPEGEKIEFQIRTKEMHETAERGIAAHWAYKEGVDKSKSKNINLDWLNRLVEWNRDLSDPNEFLETVKMDLFTEDIYVFTPRGQVMEFPTGATPLDFAYSVHTDLGHHCVGAKVNNKIVPLKHKLKSGDTIEIISSQNQKPTKDWLKIVKTSRAKSKIRQYIKAEEHQKSIQMGEMILEKELKKENLKLKALIKDGTLKKIAETFSLRSYEDLLSNLGYGKLQLGKVLGKIISKPEIKEPKSNLQKIFDEASKKSIERHTVKVKGVEDLLVRFAKCCNPVPGDSVVGFITRGRGISVHSQKCTKIFESDPNRLVDIEWDLSRKSKRKVKVKVVSEDRSGLLADMSSAIKETNANINTAHIGTTKDQKAMCLFSISIEDVNQLREIISKLQAIQGVISVERVQKS